MSNSNTDYERCGAPTNEGGKCKKLAAYQDGRCHLHTDKEPVRNTHQDLVEGATDSKASAGTRVTSVINRLQKQFPLVRELSNIDSEADTKYNGPFSYGVEWHAFFFGFACGIWYAHDPATALNVIAGIIGVAFVGEAAVNKSKRVPDYIVAQARQEMHYFAGGVVGGALFLEHMHSLGSFSFIRVFRLLGLA